MADFQLTGVKWQKLRILRNRQKFAGNIAAILFAIALISMMDGLIAGMREGSSRLDILPGQRLAISGPAATKNPLASDVISKFTPEECPLHFQLEGFFTGYWFGSGMWRGFVEAPEGSGPYECGLTVSFRGMPAKSAQRYEIRLFSDEHEQKSAAFSILKKYAGLNPFHLAAFCALCGLAPAILTYILGRIYAKGLRNCNLLTVYSPDRDGKSFICLGPPSAFAPNSDKYPVFSEYGKGIGHARALSWEKGKWRMEMDFIPPDGSLVGTRNFISP